MEPQKIIFDGRSERLTAEEWKAIKKLKREVETMLGLAKVIGVNRSTLINTIHRGSGRPETISKVREFLKNETTAA